MDMLEHLRKVLRDPGQAAAQIVSIGLQELEYKFHLEAALTGVEEQERLAFMGLAGSTATGNVHFDLLSPPTYRTGALMDLTRFCRPANISLFQRAHPEQQQRPRFGSSKHQPG